MPATYNDHKSSKRCRLIHERVEHGTQMGIPFLASGDDSPPVADNCGLIALRTSACGVAHERAKAVLNMI